MADRANPLASARTDLDDRLVQADAPILALQQACEGTVPGPLAVPQLMALVRKARHLGMRLSRQLTTQDEAHRITAWVDVVPTAEGCDITVLDWQTMALGESSEAHAAHRKDAIYQAVADGYIRLDREQRVQAGDMRHPQLAALGALVASSIGRFWTDLVDLEDFGRRVPLHWRLMNGATARLPDSEIRWTVQLAPLLGKGGETTGFDLLLTSNDAPEPGILAAATMPQATEPDATPDEPTTGISALLGQQLAPILRQPIGRIIANAETIKARLDGPLRAEYAGYATDIANAARHLLDLVQDLTDLEAIDAPGFSTAPDAIDLADVGRRAVGILQMRAAERSISIDAPKDDETLPAIGEFRRVLQILLNLISNAIRYAPEGSQIWLRLEEGDDGQLATIIVADQGPGMSDDQQARIFEKFERLGRQGDGGSGLGLYIARRLARAMGGDLTVESAPGQGARFRLSLPRG